MQPMRLLIVAVAGLALVLGSPAVPVDADVELQPALQGPAAISISDGGLNPARLRLAQAGSTGGTLGKPDQSLSGDKPNVKPAESSPPQARPKAPFPKKTAQGPRYLGCFKDKGQIGGPKDRDLDGIRQNDSGLTSARCIEICRGRGFAYAGTQNGTQCYCGRDYGRHGTATNCTTPCGGNAKETCGGWWANSIYSVGGR